MFTAKELVEERVDAVTLSKNTARALTEIVEQTSYAPTILYGPMGLIESCESRRMAQLARCSGKR